MIEYPTKVLLATDGSEDSARATEVAVALSGKAGAELHVVHVGKAPPPSTGTTVHGASLPTTPYESVVKGARKLLEDEVERAQRAGRDVAGSHLRIGTPAYEVVGLSEELGVDLVVVGSGRPRPVRRAGATALRRVVMGRASDDVVRSAPCPVLVVRGGESHDTTADGTEEAADPVRDTPETRGEPGT